MFLITLISLWILLLNNFLIHTHYFMEKLRAKLLAFPAADLNTFSRGKKKLQSIFLPERVEYVDKDPEILVFLTGGSERIALQSVSEHGFFLLLASKANNSWAAATEVKAWMNQNNVSSMLLDYTSALTAEIIDNLFDVKNGLTRLKGQRFGLVGKASDWLVNSFIDPFIIKTKLGIDQINIPWTEINLESSGSIAPDFLAFFKGSCPNSLTDAGDIYEMLLRVVSSYSLNALTVECFSVINRCNATACLALSKLCMDGIAAGCEGDTCSLLGMMLAKELFGVVPWMANINHVSTDELLFSHCTIPANLLQDFSLGTHFETGKGLAIKGKIKANEVTIVRFDHTLSKIFIGVGRVVDIPYQKTTCRTQLAVKVTPATSYYFSHNPLGNHHLIIPGNYVVGFDMVARMLRLARV